MEDWNIDNLTDTPDVFLSPEEALQSLGYQPPPPSAAEIKILDAQLELERMMATATQLIFDGERAAHLSKYAAVKSVRSPSAVPSTHGKWIDVHAM